MDPLEDFISTHREGFDQPRKPESYQAFRQKMEGQEIESYIRENRLLLEHPLPQSEALWQRLSQELDRSSGLEPFIQRHRAELDTLTPPANVWGQIEQHLDRKQTPVRHIQFSIPVPVLWRAAAAVALLVACSVVWWKWQPAPQHHETLFGQIAPELAEAERYYTALISDQLAEMRQYSPSDSTLKPTFMADLRALDEAYEQMRAEMLSTGPNDLLTAAMVENLQTRIGLLTLQLNILKNLQNKTKNEEEPIIYPL